MTEDTQARPSIVFIYNADSGLINTVKDYFHKIVKPSTYQCNLCSLTFDNFGMIHDWKTFIDNLDIDIEFLHKDEFNDKYRLPKVKFPSGYLKRGSELSILFSKKEINNCKTLDELKELVTQKVKEI